MGQRLADPELTRSASATLERAEDGLFWPDFTRGHHRPFWEILGTWEAAPIEDHEMRYLELRRLFLGDPVAQVELLGAIAAARRHCGSVRSPANR